MSAGIYRITFERPGQAPLRYIGQSATIDSRKKSHLQALRAGRHKNARLQHAFAKYGEAAFNYDPVLICDADKAIMAVYEKAILDFEIATHGRAAVANICLEEMTSALGVKRSAATIAKKRAAAMGNRSRTGMPHTAASRAKMSASVKRYVSTRDQSWRSLAAKGNKANVGRKFSAEHRAKLSASIKAAKAR